MVASSDPAASAVLRRMLRRHWITFALDALLGACFFLVGVAPGLLAKMFFDSLGAEDVSRWQSGPVLLAALVAVKVLHVAFGIAWMYVDTQLRSVLISLLRTNLMRRLLSLPASRALNVPLGDAVSRLVEDVRASVETLCKRWGLMNMTSSLSFTVVAVVVMATIDLRVMLLALLPGLAMLLASYLASQRVQRFRAQSRRAAGQVGTLLTEVFSGIQAIKLAGAEQDIQQRLRRLNSQRRAAAVRDNVFSVVLQSLSGAALAVGTGLILLVVIEPMRRGDFSVGDLALCLYLLAEVGIGVTVTARFISSWQQAQISLGRLAELQQGAPLTDLLHEGPATAATGSAAAGGDRLVSLEVRDLCCRHIDGSMALDGITFELAAGSIAVIAGRVGSGKSTLLRCLLGMTPISSGEILWNGTPVADPASFFVPPRSAYTSQVPRVFSESIRENIFLGMPYSAQLEKAAVYASVFEQDLAGLPDGADTAVGPRGHRLSGGQLQRLAAARMFARDADLLVIDDISSALDSRTEAELWQRHFARDPAKRTTLVVSNRRAALARADQVILLEDGRIAAAGALPDLLESSAALREIWEAGSAIGAEGAADQLEAAGRTLAVDSG